MDTLSRTACALLLAAGGLVPAQTANEAVALAELATMSNQMELVAVDTLFYTTLENLDDLSTETHENLFDWISYEGGALVLRPSSGRFVAERLDLTARPGGLNWAGPYVTYQPSRIDDAASAYDEGTPLDPWGSPYYLYSPLGLVAPQQRTVVLEGYRDAFDRFTIVSFGSDGIQSADDLTRGFGGSPTETVVSSVRLVMAPSERRSAYTLRVRGYRFGAEQGTGALLADGQPMTEPLTWADREVTATLAAPPSQSTAFTLRTDSGTQDTFTGFLAEGAANVTDWTFY